jgi:chromosome segregation protein
MYLKDLTINGFKSFAKKGELEFSTPITAIVGPNGSGKSNVAEAFRFVLGEQSIKSMRGKRGEDLIFSGSMSTSRSNRASVAITLMNKSRDGGRVFPIDFDEIVVERVVHRDGGNEYSINGSRMRLKDVQELLAAANIGPTGHHIISQGEADRILSASPKERREMIEDALGLKVYQYKKAESERKLAKTLENVGQVEALRKEVEPHLRFLERQIKKIEKSLELQKTLTAFYAEYLKREDTYIAHHHDRLTEERREPEKREAELASALQKTKQKLSKHEKDEKRDALVTLERDIREAREKKHDASRSVAQLEGQISFLERRVAEEQKKVERTVTPPIPFDAVQKLTETVEQSVESALQREDLPFLRRTLEDIVHSLRTLLKQASKHDDESSLAVEMQELKELTGKKKVADKDLEEAALREGELETKYNELKVSIESEASESRDAEREIFTIMNEQREVEHKLSSIEREQSALERDRNEFKRELQEAASLLGREAAKYFEHAVKTEDGGDLTKEAIVGEDRERQYERRRELERLKIRLEELGTGSNEDTVKEYKDVKERDDFLVREITDLNASVGKLEGLIDELTRELNEQFISGLEKIGTEFERFFTLMFGGGKAELKRVKPKPKKKVEDDFAGLEDEVPEEVEEEDEVEEGIEIDVKLPNKRIHGLEMLSGGERALTSIALIFAMSQVNPPLFVILDETDAALDEANSRRYGDMIAALSERSQLILITHNRETMGRAGVLYGVTMGADGISKLLSVKFDEAVAVAK